MASFAEILKVTAIDSHSYRVNITDEWCIGSADVGRPSRRPGRRRQARPADVDGAAHVCAGGAEGGARVLTHANIGLESGLTLPTAWRLDPAPPPADLEALAARGTDGTWAEWKSPRPEFRKASLNAQMYTVRRSGRVDRGVVEQWIRLRSGEPWTNTHLGFLGDMFPLMVESYDEDEGAIGAAGVSSQKQLYRHWYPTLALNLDVKKLLPPGGCPWMFVRVQSKMIANGRKDLEVIIMDDKHEIVALSHHVAMILDSSRNLAKRGEGASNGKFRWSFPWL
ncbi:hypothetical protein G7054_g10007 [Neopestalotiopsis clavispora]|nr:hypothetical protein G7054_g10007 [Neopestalotiopsis clavispora]